MSLNAAHRPMFNNLTTSPSRAVLHMYHTLAVLSCITSCLPSASLADTLLADQFSDSDGTTIFVKGFDKYLGEDAVREQLTATFADCGAVNTVRLPTDRESGELKGIGFIEFATTEAKVSCHINIWGSKYRCSDPSSSISIVLPAG